MSPSSPERSPLASRTGVIGCTDLYQEIKFRAFSLALDYLEMKNIQADRVGRGVVMDEIAQALGVAIIGEGIALNSAERSQLIEDVYNEICGLGPLEPLLQDPAVDDVIVNGHDRIYVERDGVLVKVPTRFRDDSHLMNIIQRIVGPVGRRVDEGSPYVDARLADGSRVNVIIPPVALDGPTLSIRKFRRQAMMAHTLVGRRSLSREMLDYLGRAVAGRLNLLVVGGTGSGKTTLLNVLSGFISPRERLVTIEDAAELQLNQPHVVRLETRPASPDGSREIAARELLRNTLRMRPDRIILGEVRGHEAVDMLQAMSTGHDGSMATLHANSPADALNRLEMLLAMGGFVTDMRTLRRYIANSIQVLVHVQRTTLGTRKVASVAELTGLEGDTYVLNPLFRFEDTVPPTGEGEFKTVTTRSFYANRLAAELPSLRHGGEAA